jgi:cytoskeletal protein RodZ
MAGSVTDPRTGVGPALRRAREVRGLSLDEAARDTRLRVDQLDALEREDFDVLPGEVYVRASLRTYASYLGLDADEIAGEYARTAADFEPMPPPAKLGRIERMIAASRIRDNQRLLLVMAASILIVLLAFGLLSRGAAAPPPAEIPAATGSPVPEEPTVEAILVANGEVEVRANEDGERSRVTLRPGEVVYLQGLEWLRFTVADAGLVDVSLNGRDVTDGKPGSPHTYTFAFGADVGGGSSTAG